MGHNVVTLAWMERLIAAGEVRPGASVLELGHQDVIYYTSSEAERALALGCAEAREWYAKKGLGEHASVDLHDERATYRCDLNEPVVAEVYRWWEVVYDGGTAEHIFDICHVFRTVHELTLVGGLMLHALPMTGGLDHGFWNVHPRVYRGLAEANGYEVVGLEVHENIHASVYALLGEPDDPVHVPMGMALAALRKVRGAPFEIPRQGLTS